MGKPAEVTPNSVPYKGEAIGIFRTCCYYNVADTTAKPAHGLEPFSDAITVIMIDTTQQATVKSVDIVGITPKPKPRKLLRNEIKEGLIV